MPQEGALGAHAMGKCPSEGGLYDLFLTMAISERLDKE